MTFYNDVEPTACAWLRELMAEGHIGAGQVLEKRIEDIDATYLLGATRFHAFAGIGGWDYALRIAGWPEDVPVWTGSCPCQPLSCAGKRGGEKDERHLWPEFYRLINECRPGVIFGEQVASNDGLEWLDGISLDLEELGYAVGSSDLPAASVGASHIRQRVFWVAYLPGEGSFPSTFGGLHQRQESSGPRNGEFKRYCDVGGVAYRNGGRCEQRDSRERSVSIVDKGGDAGGLAHSAGAELRPEPPTGAGLGAGHPSARADSGLAYSEYVSGCSEYEHKTGERKNEGPCYPAVGRCFSFWHDSVPILCADGKYRRVPAKDGHVEPSLFPLAYGLPGRVGLLRGAGNAIVPQVAAEFVRAFMESVGIRGNQS